MEINRDPWDLYTNDVRDNKVQKNNGCRNVIIFWLILLSFFAFLILTGCSKDNSIKPQPVDLVGIWILDMTSLQSKFNIEKIGDSYVVKKGSVNILKGEGFIGNNDFIIDITKNPTLIILSQDDTDINGVKLFISDIQSNTQTMTLFGVEAHLADNTTYYPNVPKGTIKIKRF